MLFVGEGFFLLQGFDDFFFEALDESPAPPGFDADLEDEEEEDVDTHQTPSTPGTHAADFVRPDLFFMIPGEDASA